MEEQFILRVPPSVSERVERLLNENSSSSEELDLSFTENGRSGTFLMGNDKFLVSLLDLPCVVESYKTYDDNVLIKTADIGQVGTGYIMVREEQDPAPEGVEYRHGLTPPMRYARRRRFRREPDLNPELVQSVEKDLLKIMSGRDTHTETADAETYRKKSSASAPAAKTEAAAAEAPATGGEPERSDSDDSAEPDN